MTPEQEAVIRVTGHAKAAVEVLAQPGSHLTFAQTEELLDMLALALAPRIADMLEQQP